MPQYETHAISPLSINSLKPHSAEDFARLVTEALNQAASRGGRLVLEHMIGLRATGLAENGTGMSTTAPHLVMAFEFPDASVLPTET